jgi:hypothetical protein
MLLRLGGDLYRRVPHSPHPLGHQIVVQAVR